MISMRRLRELHTNFHTLYRKLHLKQHIPYHVVKGLSGERQRELMLFDLENVIHELAHVVAQGVPIASLSTFTRLSIMQNVQEPHRVSGAVSDALEIDANAITLLVGARLRLWGARRLQEATEVHGFNLESFQGNCKTAILRQMKDPYIKKAAKELAHYLA